MMMWGNGMGWGGWLLMILTTVGFWALVVFGIVALFRGVGGGAGPRTGAGAASAHQILDERFARGEIDVEEYHARKNILPPVRS
jgi:putative membrane protein